MSQPEVSQLNKTQSLHRLQSVLNGYGSVIIAYSGGVDSTFLCKFAYETLGDKAVALTARSSTYPTRELEAARSIARQIGIRHLEIDSEELDIPGFAQNDRNRCFYCKQELFPKLLGLATELDLKAVLEGSNLDDNGDYRPGLKAAEALGIKSPLRQAGFDKQLIREISRDLNLSTWDKPSFACQSSRFPYGESINSEKLRQVEQAEQFLFDRGFTQVRVRHHGQVARIEILTQEIPRLLDQGLEIELYSYFKSLGFMYTTLDLAGYRTGSMNDAIVTSI